MNMRRSHYADYLFHGSDKIEMFYQITVCMSAVILKNIAASILAYSTHYAAIKFYNYACVQDGFVGYINGIITTGSPVCQSVVQVISSTQVSYSSIILMSITRIVVEMVAPNHNVKSE
jgi:hypothetical protein